MAVCKFCGQDGLQWVETENGWRLWVFGEEDWHDCPQRPQSRGVSKLLTRLDNAKEELEQLRQAYKVLEDDNQHLRHRLFELTREAREAKKPVLDEAFLTDLIRLCHPDRQPADRWQLANRITARLNGMRH